MKFIIFIFLSFILLLNTNISSAQVSEGIKYQAAIRDGQGNLIAENGIDLKVSLISNSITGNIEYQEIHHITTNKFGLINIIIGQGDVLSGDFSKIVWQKNNMFFKIELDIDKTGNFTEIGTSEILSVPYAFSSKTAINSTYADTAYFVFNESISNDKQIRFEFGPSTTYGITTTTGQILDKPSQTIMKFDKNNYANVKSVVFGASIYSSNSSSSCTVELWDITNNMKIANSSLISSETTESYIESQNILQNLPEGEISLAVKIVSGVENSGAWISKAYLFINRSNNLLIEKPEVIVK